MHSNEKDRVQNYLISDPERQKQFDYHSGSIETVRQEIGLLRMLLYERVNLARTEADRINAFQVIHPAVVTINKLVDSLGKLERQTNTVLEKESATQLAKMIGTILVEEIAAVDPSGEIVDRVASRIASVIADAHN